MPAASTAPDVPVGTIVAPAAGGCVTENGGRSAPPLWRSSINSSREAGGTTSPSGCETSVARVNTRKRPSGVRAGWNSSAAVFTELGTTSVLPVWALTRPMSKPLPGT